MSAKTSILTFAAITALPRGERYTLFRDNVVKPFGAINKAKETATEKMHNAFKVVAMLKRDYAEMLHKKEIAPDTTEAKFFKEYAGGDVPARVKQLATFFNAVVLTGPKPLIPENFLDAASVNSLEKAAAIIAAERKACTEAWMGTDITLDTVLALSTPGDATKKLAEIRKRQKPAAGDDSGAETPSAVLTMLLKNRIAEAADTDDGYALFCLMQELAEAWSQNKQVPAERYADWLQRREQETKPAHHTGGEPAPQNAEQAEAAADLADQREAALFPEAAPAQ